MKDGKWYKDAIDVSVSNGLSSGYPDNTIKHENTNVFEDFKDNKSKNYRLAKSQEKQYTPLQQKLKERDIKAECLDSKAMSTNNIMRTNTPTKDNRSMSMYLFDCIIMFTFNLLLW